MFTAEAQKIPCQSGIVFLKCSSNGKLNKQFGMFIGKVLFKKLCPCSGGRH